MTMDSKIKSKTKNKKVLVATGASGGHMFPALAVADELKSAGYTCIFVGEGRSFTKIIEEAGYRWIPLPASAWNVRNPFRKLKALYNFCRAFGRALKLIHQEDVSAVFGTGGYSTVAAVIAGKVSGVPTIVQEQNVKPGRANKLLSRLVDRMCLAYDDSRHYLKYREGVMKVCGNPVRKEFLSLQTAKKPTPAKSADAKFTLLVLGGSQGARILSEVVPDAVKNLSYELQHNIIVMQQARPEDAKQVQMEYQKFGVVAEVASFWNDIPQRMENADLVIGRSGASMISECTILGKASILVPLKLADGHQLLNARMLERESACIILEQNEFTPENLSQEITSLMQNRDKLVKMGQQAQSVAQPDAAKLVADEVMKMADNDIMHMAS